MNELALFAGAGGGILGGKLHGRRTVCAVERDAYAAQVLAQRQNDGILEAFPIWSDVTTFDGRPWNGIVDVISGGFPCQDISAAGAGVGIDGARSGLWGHMARIIRQVEPRSVEVETAQCSLLADSDEFLETWPRWGSMLNGVSYLRQIPALPICESASGLWQTPVADDAVERKVGKWNSRGEPKLSAEVKLYPTVTVNGNNNRPKTGTKRGTGLASAARDLNCADGQLNPEWVEWLMGWPIGWTGLKPLAMDKFREWKQQHGNCSQHYLAA